MPDTSCCGMIDGLISDSSPSPLRRPLACLPAPGAEAIPVELDLSIAVTAGSALDCKQAICLTTYGYDPRRSVERYQGKCSISLGLLDAFRHICCS